jgi:hypothetical protein
MDDLPLHPQIVHLPIALAVVMPIVAGGLLAAWWAGALPRRVWIVAVALQALLVTGGIVALRTGEGEEERVERLVGKDPIEVHEEAAEAFVWTAGAVLLLAVAASMVGGEVAARRLAAATTVGTLVVFLLAYRTGAAGGRLVYQHGAANAYVSAPEQ